MVVIDLVNLIWGTETFKCLLLFGTIWNTYQYCVNVSGMLVLLLNFFKVALNFCITSKSIVLKKKIWFSIGSIYTKRKLAQIISLLQCAFSPSFLAAFLLFVHVSLSVLAFVILMILCYWRELFSFNGSLVPEHFKMVLKFSISAERWMCVCACGLFLFGG